MHRDVKLENILIEKMQGEDDLFIKLADFGMSQYLDVHSSEKTQAGSMNYMAPEILNFEPSDGGCDVWSACIVIFILFTR